MPESIMKKVDGNGQTKEILGNGGSYTARVLDVDGSVVASQDVGTMNEAIAILETLQAPEPVAEEVAEEPKSPSTRARGRRSGRSGRSHGVKGK